MPLVSYSRPAIGCLLSLDFSSRIGFYALRLPSRSMGKGWSNCQSGGTWHNDFYRTKHASMLVILLKWKMRCSPPRYVHRTEEQGWTDKRRWMGQGAKVSSVDFTTAQRSDTESPECGEVSISRPVVGQVFLVAFWDPCRRVGLGWFAGWPWGR